MAVAEDDVLCRVIAEMPVIQPNLFFASIQYLAGLGHMPGTAAELSDFVEGQRSAIGDLMRARRTQTNEVARCASILPAFPTGPLALIEVGASAGLCLLLDSFAYDYSGLKLGSSPLELPCTVENGTKPPIPTELPRIIWRAGLDLEPVDLSDDNEVRWLRSCVWADHRERHARLAAAVEIGRVRQPTVHRGDLVTDLPALLTEVPEDTNLVVFHCATLTYVTHKRRNDFAALLGAHSQERAICLISNEGPGVVPEISVLADPYAGPELRFLLGRTTFAEGKRHDELLALVHPHGTALEWLSDDPRLPVT
jgi:hypothetical protein